MKTGRRWTLKELKKLLGDSAATDLRLDYDGNKPVLVELFPGPPDMPQEKYMTTQWECACGHVWTEPGDGPSNPSCQKCGEEEVKQMPGGDGKDESAEKPE